LELEECISFRKGQRMHLKRDYGNVQNPNVRGICMSPTGNVRKVRKKQVGIMAEVVQMKWQRALHQATFCSLSMDGSNGQKVVRFRCDLPDAPWVLRGILGVLDEVIIEKLDDADQDCALTTTLKLDLVITQFCTPLGEPVNQDLKDHLLNIIRVVAVDGAPAERRAISLASNRLFTRLVTVIRDAAHAIRIAMKNSLQYDEVFSTVWKELFDNPNALVLLH
jgi:hypothetical protein